MESPTIEVSNTESTNLDYNVLNFKIGTVVDAYIATESLSQINRPVPKLKIRELF